MAKSSDFWLFKEHSGHIELLDISCFEHYKRIVERFQLPDVEKNPDNTRLNWQPIVPCYKFFYDYLGSEHEIGEYLKNSKLMDSKQVLIESRADNPIILTSTDYFIANWYELTESLVGMGCLVVSEDYEYLMEFTDDAKYLLYSNFRIKNSQRS